MRSLHQVDEVREANEIISARCLLPARTLRSTPVRPSLARALPACSPGCVSQTPCPTYLLPSRHFYKLFLFFIIPLPKQAPLSRISPPPSPSPHQARRLHTRGFAVRKRSLAAGKRNLAGYVNKGAAKKIKVLADLARARERGYWGVKTSVGFPRPPSPTHTHTHSHEPYQSNAQRQSPKHTNTLVGFTRSMFARVPFI